MFSHRASRVSTSTSLFETCQGGGVYLRHPQMADYEAWKALRLESRNHLARWEPSWDQAHLSLQNYRSRLGRFKKMLGQDQSYPFHIFRASDNRLVGACNLTHVQRTVKQSASLGYWIGEAYARQGFARASVRAASKFAFETLGLHRLEAAVQAENEASIALLEQLGFQYEGVGRGYLKINGAWRDHNLYARLASDDVPLQRELNERSVKR